MPNRHVPAAAPGLPRTHLHLVSDNPAPTPERWEGRRENTLLTFTLSRRDIDGALIGVKNLLWANARMAQALQAMEDGDEIRARESMDRAFAEMVSANAVAERVYNHIRAQAVRAKPRKVRS